MTLNCNETHLRPGADTDAGLVRLIDFRESIYMDVRMAVKVIYTDPRGVKRVLKDRYGNAAS